MIEATALDDSIGAMDIITKVNGSMAEDLARESTIHHLGECFFKSGTKTESSMPMIEGTLVANLRLTCLNPQKERLRTLYNPP